MATPPTRKAILDLYHQTLRASQAFSSYNFREYFVQRTKDAFHAMQNETDPAKVRMLYDSAAKELPGLRRSALVNQIYGGWKLAIEKEEKEPGQFKTRGDN